MSALRATYTLVSAIQSIAKSSLPEPLSGIRGETQRRSFDATGSARTLSRRLSLLMLYQPPPAILLAGRSALALAHQRESFVNQNFPTSEFTPIVGGLNGSASIRANATSANRVL